MSFQYNAKSVFLTYAQCPLEKQVLLDFLQTKGTLTKCAIAREAHEDGNFHLHCAVWFDDNLRFRDPAHLDI